MGIINDTDALNIEGCLARLYIARWSLNIVLSDGHWTVYIDLLRFKLNYLMDK